jgi:hypothetical protein
MILDSPDVPRLPPGPEGGAGRLGIVVTLPLGPAVWLRTELHAAGLEVVTVALDSAGSEAARPWIEAARLAPDNWTTSARRGAS